MAGSVPLRRSLLVRLLAVSVLIALCSIAATAWLAVQTTTRAFQQAQGQALSSDVTIYDTLVGYGATHASWDGVGPTVDKLARSTGRQITLTTQERVPIAGMSPAPLPGSLPQKASAVVDPLHTDPTLKPDVDVRIDPRVVGPYRLTPAKRLAQQVLTGKTLDCLTKTTGSFPGVTQKDGLTSDLSTAPAVQDLAGYITFQPAVVGFKLPLEGLEKYLAFCNLPPLAKAGTVEAAALADLTRSVDTCLDRRKRKAVALSLPYNVQYQPSERFSDDRTVQNCLDTARRAQFREYVAPAALLFVRSPGGISQTRFDLSRGNLARRSGTDRG